MMAEALQESLSCSRKYKKELDIEQKEALEGLISPGT